LYLDPNIFIDPTTKHDFNIVISTDANWGGCPRTRKSSSGVLVDSRVHLYTSFSMTQSVIAQSSAESELYAIGSGVLEGLQIRFYYHRSMTSKKRDDRYTRGCI
jgi:hypothetical protein